LSGVSSRSPLIPITAFIGVRISWLIVARKELFASLAASAAARACCASLNRRTFSIAITAWSANVCASEISFASNSPVPARRIVRQPMARPSRSKRNEQRGTITQRECELGIRANCFAPSHGVGDGDDARLQDAASRTAAAIQRPGFQEAACALSTPSLAKATLSIMLPFGITSATALPPKSLWQLCTMASNTGCVSLIDALITRRSLAVAVCCSSASFVSLNKRTFSMAITAWSAKVLSSSSWTCEIGPALPADADHAEHLPSRSIGTLSPPPPAPDSRQGFDRNRVVEHIFQGDNRLAENHPSGNLRGVGRIGNFARISSGIRIRSLLAAKCSHSPSNSSTLAKEAAAEGAALRTMASNTGWRSVCELLMTSG
jgi:hypothetical protein